MASYVYTGRITQDTECAWGGDTNVQISVRRWFAREDEASAWLHSVQPEGMRLRNGELYTEAMRLRTGVVRDRTTKLFVAYIACYLDLRFLTDAEDVTRVHSMCNGWSDGHFDASQRQVTYITGDFEVTGARR
jgi:hypothetical protein